MYDNLKMYEPPHGTVNKITCAYFQLGPDVITLFSYTIQLSLKFILLINVKMPIFGGILAFISRINDWLSWFKPVWAISVFMSNLNFVLSLIEHAKSFITSRPDESLPTACR